MADLAPAKASSSPKATSPGCPSPTAVALGVRTVVAGGRYQLLSLVGQGGFGQVYHGIDTQAPEIRVAVKVERRRRNRYLYHETCVIERLTKFVDVTVGFPLVLYYGDEGDYSVMVMNLLGPSLEDLLDVFGHFSIKTVVMLALQMTARIEFMHALGFIHRDIKPENFLMGLGKLSHHVYLIDFGLSTRYRSSNGHRPLATGRSLVGTCRYASLRTHEGFSQSRRDDLEQLCYTLVYIRRGKLPWTGLHVSDQAVKEKKVMEMKLTLPLQAICKRCPPQFEDLLLYARKMGHEEAPRYEMINALLQSIMEDNKWANDYRFDWTPRRRASPKSEGSSMSTVGADGRTRNGRQEHDGDLRDEDDQLLMSMSAQDNPVFSNAEACGLSGNNGEGDRPLSPISSPLVDDAVTPEPFDESLRR